MNGGLLGVQAKTDELPYIVWKSPFQSCKHIGRPLSLNLSKVASHHDSSDHDNDDDLIIIYDYDDNEYVNWREEGCFGFDIPDDQGIGSVLD